MSHQYLLRDKKYMSSVNFNGAAQSALRTLQASNRDLDATQARISTGLRIGEAKDNAAYWSISTTLKSDNKALSSVSDALGLGGATVDVAYEGLNQAADVLDEIKKKIVAASGDAADKVALQSEIKELQKQLTAIAGASSFSGENWLAIDSSSSSYLAEKTVVSSFNRDKSGAVTLDTIKIASGSFALTDASGTKEGILDGGKLGNQLIGGIEAVASGTTVTAAKASANLSGFAVDTANAQTLNATITVNGYNYTISGANNIAANGTTAAVKTLIDNAVPQSGAPALSTLITVTVVDANNVLLESIDSNDNQTISVVLGNAPADGGMVADTPTAGVSAGLKTDGTAFGSGKILLDGNDSIDFKVTVNGVAKEFSVTQATVLATSGLSPAGEISDADDYAKVINTALSQAGITGLKAKVDGANVDFHAAGATTMSTAVASASRGTSILTLDVTTASRAKLTTYLNSVNTALSKVTASASTLGAISKRIELQKDFVTTLMDTIDKGVSGLVDADMNEESTKLQALQVKQQLGVQALSIANQSAQNVLSLFRG
ncbi:flagellin [Aureimonas sp. SK2]|uniref:flagellin N-terminal helical domain-containing protein n=1 Tax=Aureimonas sp. SK2 TaxID=3015992 RepID=UPI002443C84C|nr:flagellin [Aureimonas sp. SK2]